MDVVTLSAAKAYGRGAYAGRLAPSALASLAVNSGEATVDGFRDVVSWRGSVYLAGAWNNGGVTLGGKLYTVDLTTGVLTMVYDTGQQTIATILPYGDKLYLGTGIGGRVYSWDGTTGALAFTGTVGHTMQASAVVNGVAYFGETAGGKVFSLTGTTWATACTLPSPQVTVYSLRRWQNMLLIGGATASDTAAWQVFLFDGTNLGAIQGFVGASNTHSEALALEVWRGDVYVSEYSSGGSAQVTRWSPTTGAVTRVASASGATALYGMRVYRDALYVLSHPSGVLYRWDGASLVTVGTASGGGSLRRAVVVDDRLLVTRMLIGTGGAATLYVYGDGANRIAPGQEQEVPSAIDFFPAEAAFIGTFDPRIPTTALSVLSANRAWWGKVRVRRPRWVSSLATSIGTSSGNLSLGISAADGTSGVPGTLLATTGGVASPGTGYRAIALTAGVWLLPGIDYWFGLSADNTTLTFNVLNPATTGHGLTARMDTAYPLPNPAVTPDMTSGAAFPVWAV